MPRAREWYKYHAPSTWVVMLEILAKLLNIVLALAGLLLIAYAVVAAVRLHHDEDADEQQLPDGNATDLQAWRLSAEHHGAPWFIYAAGALGLATFLTATLALVGAYCRSVTALNANIVLMCCGLALQACIAVFIFVDKSWEQKLPPETSGEYEKIKAFLEARLAVCKWGALGIACLQLLVLLLNCALQSAYVRTEEVAEDIEEEQAHQPLLPQHHGAGPSTSVPVRLPATAVKHDNWSMRMQERYGLDTSRFSYNPEEGSTITATTRGEHPRQASRCRMM